MNTIGKPRKEDSNMSDVAREKAARLLKKRASTTSTDPAHPVHRVGMLSRMHGSMSTISFADEPHDDALRPPIRLENTYQLSPNRKLSTLAVTNVIKDVLESYLSEEKYDPELCKQMTKTLSEIVKARVKELMVPRYKIICVVHIGQLDGQGMRIGSRCLWDHKNDTYSTYEFRNHSLFAVGTVYGVYSE